MITGGSYADGTLSLNKVDGTSIGVDIPLPETCTILHPFKINQSLIESYEKVSSFGTTTIHSFTYGDGIQSYDCIHAPFPYKYEEWTLLGSFYNGVGGYAIQVSDEFMSILESMLDLPKLIELDAGEWDIIISSIYRNMGGNRVALSGPTPVCLHRYSNPDRIEIMDSRKNIFVPTNSDLQNPEETFLQEDFYITGIYINP